MREKTLLHCFVIMSAVFVTLPVEPQHRIARESVYIKHGVAESSLCVPKGWHDTVLSTMKRSITIT